jgi:hypothetical protein
MPKRNIQAWWSTLLPKHRREHVRTCGLGEDLESKSWSALTGTEQAALRRRYTEKHEDDA